MTMTATFEMEEDNNVKAQTIRGRHGAQAGGWPLGTDGKYSYEQEQISRLKN